MLVREVMTEGCKTCVVGDAVAAAAKLMATEEIGIVPVVANDRLVGMVTDRDIVIRGVSIGADLNKTPVEELMTDNVYYCFDDQSCESIATNMAELQVRRLPVVDRNKKLVGIVALGDLAANGAPAKAKKALKGVSRDRQAASRDNPN